MSFRERRFQARRAHELHAYLARVKPARRPPPEQLALPLDHQYRSHAAEPRQPATASQRPRDR
jgi:hypothetical protein